MTEFSTRIVEETQRALVSGRSGPALPGFVPDAPWLGMYRVRMRDGLLSDMVNLTRAKDAVRTLAEAARREQQEEAA